jgi:tRNA G18 (ribose-2'-O)-methylase SpoU
VPHRERADAIEFVHTRTVRDAPEGYGGAAMLLDDPLDPRVREYAHLRAATLRLRADGPEGARDGVFIAEGELVIERALALGYRMRSLLLLEQRLQRFARLAPAGVPVYAASNELMRSITGFAVHRGVLSSFDRKPLPGVGEVVREAHRVVLLEDVNNHTNVGAIVRSASALGIDALLLDPNSCDPLYRRSLRISMGEALSLPHARTDPLPAGLAPLRDAGFILAALTPGSDAEDIAAVAAARHDRLALLLGAEGPGLSPALLAEADVQVRIPLAAGVDSLNVAAAAAIAFYALAR